MKNEVKALEAFIHQLLGAGKNVEVKVYTWGGKKGGRRISEINLTTRREGGALSGSTWQRSNPDAGGIILAAEDFLLTFGLKPWRPKGWTSYLDDHGDAKDRLKYLLGVSNGKKPRRRRHDPRRHKAKVR